MDAIEKKISKKMKEVNVLDKKILKLEGELRILKRKREAKLQIALNIYNLYRNHSL